MVSPFVLRIWTRIRAHGHGRAAPPCCGPPHCIPSSSIRTVTVGFGFAPNLLTSSALSIRGALAGSCSVSANTAGGDFRPALRTMAPDTAQGRNVYRTRRRRQQSPVWCAGAAAAMSLAMALLRSIATVGGYTLASRVLGFVRDVLVAA